jgi:hypothetical protein
MTIYLFHLLGSRFAGWWYGLYLDETGRKRAQKAWAEEVTSKAWMSYLGAVDDAIKPTRSSFKFAEKK